MILWGARVGLLALGAMAWAQQPVVIHTETRTVLVEAVVTGKKGEFVENLTAKDFRIWQDGKEQAITSISAEAKSTEPHFLVLFFDNTRMTVQDQAQARLAVSRFIDANAAPGRLMAVVSYSKGLLVLQNFTDNAGRLKDALSRLEVSTGIATAAKPPGGAAVVDDNFQSRNMLQALAGLAKGLGVLPGRKTVMLLTAGIRSSSEAISQAAAAIESSSRSGVAVYPIDVQPVTGAVDQGQDPSRNRPTRTYDRLRPQGNEDSSSRDQDPSAASQPLLVALANGTGGFLIPDSSDLLRGLQQIGQEQSAYYVLSYTPPESKEGSCHALRVKVDRRGAAVRARSTYCTTKPLDLIAGTPAAKELESRAAGADSPGTLKASIQLPYFYVLPSAARVHLAMEIQPDTLKFENQKGRLHAEINLLGIASTTDGDERARFSDTLKLDFDNQAEVEKLKGAPVHYEREFKIAPGEYHFILTFGQGGGTFGKIERSLTVEPWNRAELTLSGVALSRETHPAADLGLVSSLLGDRTPLVVEGTQFIPLGSNQFVTSDTGYFYLEFYDPDPASVSVHMRVLDRKTGESKWDSGVTKLQLQGNAGRVAIPAGASLQLNRLAGGAYQLEITASDSTGKQVKRTSDFEAK